MTSVKRRAPEKGYDNDEKQKYRHHVWSILSKECLHVLASSDIFKVLILPSKEGLEIDVAIEYGIKPHQIIAIDENPAVIAVSSWRKKYPEVNYFGCKVSEVAKKIEEKGWSLACANLDLCNNFSHELITELNAFLKNVPRYIDFSFFVTFGKGREGKALLMLLNELEAPTCFKYPRSAALYHMIKNLPINRKMALGLLCEQQYISSRVPMVYLGMKFNQSELEDEWKRILAERRKEINQHLRLKKVKTIDFKTKDKFRFKEIESKIFQSMRDTGVRQEKEIEVFAEKNNIISNEFKWWLVKMLSTAQRSYDNQFTTTDRAMGMVGKYFGQALKSYTNTRP